MPERVWPKTPRYRHSWGAAHTAHRCWQSPDSSASCAGSTGTAEGTLPPSAHIVPDRASRGRSPPCCALERCIRRNVIVRTTNDTSEQCQDRAVRLSRMHTESVCGSTQRTARRTTYGNKQQHQVRAVPRSRTHTRLVRNCKPRTTRHTKGTTTISHRTHTCVVCLAGSQPPRRRLPRGPC
jgi:hypothetical protein